MKQAGKIGFTVAHLFCNFAGSCQGVDVMLDIAHNPVNRFFCGGLFGVQQGNFRLLPHEIAISQQNQLFRKLLKLQEQRRDFTFVSAAVLAHSEDNWTSSLTLSHGTDQDIAVGDCVVSAEGYLVGVVSKVGLNWSTVLTVVDTDTELGARIFRTGEIAVAGEEGTLEGLNCAELNPVADLIATAVKVSSDKAARAKK